MQISDNLREMHLKEDSENWDLYSEEEKAQLLYRIFRHMSLGGGICQFEVRLSNSKIGAFISALGSYLALKQTISDVTKLYWNEVLILFILE